MEPNYVFKASFRYLESYRTRMQTVFFAVTALHDKQVKSQDAASLSRSLCSCHSQLSYNVTNSLYAKVATFYTKWEISILSFENLS